MKRTAIGVCLVTAALATACGGVSRSAPAPTAVVEEPRPVAAPPPSKGSLESRLRKSSMLGPILDQAATYRFQVLVSVPSPDGSGWLEREGFRVDAEYFYPASAIKLCSAVAALEALGDLRESKGSHLDVSATLVSESSAKRRGGGITVANLVLGALVMSDNEASNDLFDLAGHDGFHERMWRLGLSSVRMRHRLGTTPGDDARATPRIELVTSGETVVVPAREGRLALGKNDQNGVQVGESHFSRGRLVNEPMSFEEKNRISLADLQELLIAVMRPELRTSAPRLGAQERAVLVDALTGLPSARGARASVDREHKPLRDGIERVVPRESLTLASKSGRAYGFLVENAYVLDARTGRSFFLAATVHANANGRLNDDFYEYGDLAFPLFAELGELVARTVLDAPM